MKTALTKAELIVADNILLELPAGVEFVIYGRLQNVTKKAYDYPNEADEIIKIVTSGTSAIRSFLLQEEYIICIDHSTQKDKLSPKGIQAQKEGGHSQYLIWEQIDKIQKQKEQNKLNFAQKNWLLIAIVTLVVGWFADLGKEVIIAKYIEPKIIVRTDTIFLQSPNQYKDLTTMLKQDQRSTTSLNKKDTLH